jgi:Amt family ammonium transporter
LSPLTHPLSFSSPPRAFIIILRLPPACRIGAVLVFLMQTGFAMLEVGSVSAKNTHNILLKNVLDASIGAILWWLIGYGIAMGDSPSRVVGTTKYGLVAADFEDGSGYSYASWLFQWAFAATTATIVSGAVAERCTIIAYLVYSSALIAFICTCHFSAFCSERSWGISRHIA